MKVRRILVTAAVLTMGCLCGQEHPRWLFPPRSEGVIRARVKKDPLFRKVVDQVMTRADQALEERTCEYRIPDGKRLLSESRHALHQVLHCGMAWRLSGEEKYRQRVIREVEAACALKDWNPSHFLDVSEMATAVAVAYDWLYPTLTEAERERWLDALEYKALHPLGKMHEKSGWWKGPTNNWSQVCGTGMAYAAEMVTDRRKEWSGLYRKATDLVESCRKFYEPAGGYPEGPDYWHYGSNYQVLMLAADPKLEASRVLQRSGDFMMQMTGPLGWSFNFADGGLRWETPTAAQSWLATKFRNAGQSRHVRRMMERALERGIRGGTSSDLRFFPLHVLWLPEEPRGGVAEAPRVEVFEGEQPVASLRSGWKENAAWLAIKGGSGASSHGHLDAGAFVYEAKGQRWFHDMGKENYNLPGYFGAKRWDYFRLTNFAHSTLVIGGKRQGAPKSPVATVVEERESGGEASLVVDLTPVYRGQAAQVERRVGFRLKDGACEIEDHLEEPAGEVRWAVVTQAAVEFRGDKVVLSQGGKKLVMSRLDREGGEWEEYSLKPPTAEENPNTGFRLIGFTVPAKKSLSLRVAWE